MKLDFDVVVIGSGPSGITASIYVKRANLSVLMIDSNAPGGQLNRISTIENYPGFTKIAGPDLAYNMYMQTRENEIPYKYGKVLDIVDNKEYKTIKLAKEEIKCKSIIIASGRKPRELGLPNEKKLAGKGISWCAICDGALFKDKNVAVIGGGNSAIEESLYLSNIAKEVNIIYKGSIFSADKVYQDRMIGNNKIHIYYNSDVTGINIKDDKLSGIEVKNNLNDEIKNMEVTGMFIYIGFEPSTDYAKSLGIINEDSYITVDRKMKTNISHVYACGDVIKKDLYQITTAIAEGSIAATTAIKEIEK